MDPVNIIQALGFPIFVCLWLMYRVEKRLDKMQQEQHRTNVLQAVMLKTLDDDGRMTENIQMLEAGGQLDSAKKEES